MNATERRLRALETAFSVVPRRPARQIIVGPSLGETVAGVLAREGIDEQETFVIARMIVDPKPIDDSPTG